MGESLVHSWSPREPVASVMDGMGGTYSVLTDGLDLGNSFFVRRLCSKGIRAPGGSDFIGGVVAWCNQVVACTNQLVGCYTELPDTGRVRTGTDRMHYRYRQRARVGKATLRRYGTVPDQMSVRCPLPGRASLCSRPQDHAQ